MKFAAGPEFGKISSTLQNENEKILGIKVNKTKHRGREVY